MKEKREVKEALITKMIQERGKKIKKEIEMLKKEEKELRAEAVWQRRKVKALEKILEVLEKEKKEKTEIIERLKEKVLILSMGKFFYFLLPQGLLIWNLKENRFFLNEKEILLSPQMLTFLFKREIKILEELKKLE